MIYSNNLTILVADANETLRAHIAELLSAHGYRVLQAIDGGSAIKVAEENIIDAAIIGYNMKPRTGFDFATHALLKKYDFGIIMVTDDATSDLLVEAGKLEIKQVIRTPIDPDRLFETLRRVLRSSGRNPDAFGDAGLGRPYSREELMERAIALAGQNARALMGGPFGAIVATADGRIIGEGVNSVQSRCDPTAHAEVMAIRRAAERLNTTRLDGCVLYASSEPTMLGQALLISVGISHVYYALSHKEAGYVRAQEDGILGEIAKPLSERSVPYTQLAHDEAAQMFSAWLGQERKLND